MTTPTRPDASMTLLREVMERPLDPGYAAAAADRQAGGARERPGRRLVTAAAAVVVGVLLTAAIVDLRLPGTTDARTVLLDEIATRTTAADATAARVEDLRSEVEQLQVEALADGGTNVLEISQRLALNAGAVPVTGAGVVVTLDDASSARDPLSGDPREDQVQDDRVVDLDVRIAVNGLWAAGAEAIAVNGQRLTSLSAIRWAGGAILVGFRPLEPPYRIEAIGDPVGMRTELARSPAGSYLAFIQERYGLRVSTERSNSLELPGAGTLQLRYARPGTSPADDSMDSSEVDE
jgi:uncharacterized protein YlxW (UPF0749 family)